MEKIKENKDKLERFEKNIQKTKKAQKKKQIKQQ